MSHAKMYHCPTHGDWNALIESGCPICLAEMREEIKALKRQRDEQFQRTLDQTEKLADANRALSAVHAALCNIHDRCIDNVDVDEESGTGDRTPNLEGHIVMECDEAIAAIERVIGKRP